MIWHLLISNVTPSRPLLAIKFFFFKNQCAAMTAGHSSMDSSSPVIKVGKRVAAVRTPLSTAPDGRRHRGAADFEFTGGDADESVGGIFGAALLSSLDASRRPTVKRRLLEGADAETPAKARGAARVHAHGEFGRPLFGDADLPPYLPPHIPQAARPPDLPALLDWALRASVAGPRRGDKEPFHVPPVLEYLGELCSLALWGEGGAGGGGASALGGGRPAHASRRGFDLYVDDDGSGSLEPGGPIHFARAAALLSAAAALYGQRVDALAVAGGRLAAKLTLRAPGDGDAARDGPSGADGAAPETPQQGKGGGGSVPSPQGHASPAAAASNSTTPPKVRCFSRSSGNPRSKIADGAPCLDLHV